MNKQIKTKVTVKTIYGSCLNKTQIAGYKSLLKLLKKEAYWSNAFAMYDGFKNYFTPIIDKEED